MKLLYIDATNAETVQINTGRECPLNAYHIYQIINNKVFNLKYEKD